MKTAGGPSSSAPLWIPPQCGGRRRRPPHCGGGGRRPLPIFTDYSFAEIPRLADNDLAHICLVDNPEHNKNGDFILNNNQLKNIEPIEKSKFKNEITYTFSGISIFRPEFFEGKDTEQILKLGPMIKKAVNQGRVSANLLDCAWTDVGTPERLANLNK